MTHVVPFARAGDVLASTDHEIFAVNLLMTGGERRGELKDFYRAACDLVEFDLAPLAIR